MKNLHIENSYNIWNYRKMREDLMIASLLTYSDARVKKLLNRSWISMYLEWWLHNIGYYVTKPFLWSARIKALNERFKHADINEHK